ncbi:MAG: hypothetical protein WD845_08195 [Pirellulales bacterium]
MKRCTPGRITIAGTLLVAMLVSGCAAVKAVRQPEKRDMHVLDRGVPRTHVIAELGSPVWSDERDGAQVDVFSFKQGYTKVNKAARAMAHGAADVATFGLWEVVGLPAEALANGTDVQLEVYYGPDQTVDHVVVIKGDKAVQPRKLFARKSRAPHISTGKQAPPVAIAREPDAVIAGDGDTVR